MCGQNPAIRSRFRLASSLLVPCTCRSDEVAHRGRTIIQKTNRKNSTTHIKRVLASLLLVPCTCRCDEVAHRCRTYTLATNRPKPQFKIYFLLAKCLLAQRRLMRLSMSTKQIEILLDVCRVVFLLSTWCVHALAPRINEIKIVLDPHYVECLLACWRRRIQTKHEHQTNQNCTGRPLRQKSTFYLAPAGPAA